MEKTWPKIGIVYLLYYHNESYIDDVVSALKKITYPKDKLELIIVSNPHEEHGSFLHYVDSVVMPLSGNVLPRVTVLPQEKNEGFAGGNNVGAAWAVAHGCDYVFFNNNDGFFAANAIEPLTHAFDQDPTIGAAQSLILLHPETQLVNCTGNSFHYLGFGFCDNYRVDINTLHLPPIQDVNYASGAAFMVRSDLIKKFGAWDHDFFLYHEDLEWSFRLKMAGYRVVLVRDSVFYHKYLFSRSITKFYWMERNRYAVMFMFFQWKTLFLLLPMALLLEVGLFLFAIKGGWLDKRIAVYRYWLQPKHIMLWYKKRKRIQEIRKTSGTKDKDILQTAVSEILFQDQSMKNPLLLYIGNPMMKAYYTIISACIRW